MNNGALYVVKKWFWLLFPTKETADAMANDDILDSAAVSTGTFASWWSKTLNSETYFFSPDSIVVFLEEDGKFKRVLTSDGRIGWTWFIESYNYCFEEVKHP